MVVSTDQVIKGVADYLDHEFLAQYPDNSPKKYMIGVGLALFTDNYKNKLDLIKTNPYLNMFGLFNDSGMVNIDEIKKVASAQMPECGITFDLNLKGVWAFLANDFNKVTLTKEDVDSIYSYITKRGEN